VTISAKQISNLKPKTSILRNGTSRQTQLVKPHQGKNRLVLRRVVVNWERNAENWGDLILRAEWRDGAGQTQDENPSDVVK
jgi:hypothetical protein